MNEPQVLGEEAYANIASNMVLQNRSTNLTEFMCLQSAFDLP